MVKFERDVRLVDDDQVRFGDDTVLERLDAAHLNGLTVVCPLVHRLDDADVPNTVCLEPLDGLVDQADGWNTEQDFLALILSHVDDGGGGNGLASTCRHLKDWTFPTARQRTSNMLDG